MLLPCKEQYHTLQNDTSRTLELILNYPGCLIGNIAAILKYSSLDSPSCHFLVGKPACSW